MIQSWKSKALKRVYNGDLKAVGAEILERVRVALSALDCAVVSKDVDVPGFRLHPLRGDRKGRWSITITGNWRITFRIEQGNVYDVDLEDYH